MRSLTLLLFVFFANILWAQETTIKGKVIDEYGEPLIGASVYIDKSTIGEKTAAEGIIANHNLGTIADLNGEFSLNIPKGITHLTFGFIGYETLQVEIGNKTHLTVKMKESSNTLNTVVFTGYQKVEKRKLTSAVSTVKASDIVQSGTSSIDVMLGGQVAGVAVAPTSGAPGAPAKIRIRGTASMSGTQDPLWVLDGMPLEGTNLPSLDDKDISQLFTSTIAGINPSDIEDITILKDAAATAIYGVKAANGVILITTKKGKVGKPVVNFNSKLTFVSRPDMDKLQLMNSSEKLDMELRLAKYPDLDSNNPNTTRGAIGQLFEKHGVLEQYRTGGLASLPAELQANIANLRGINTKWGDEIYRTAVNQDYGLSINGGSERATYYFSTGYYNELGNIDQTSLKRLNVTLKSDFKIFDNLKVGASIFYNERTRGDFLAGGGWETNPNNYARIANPYTPIYNEDGSYHYDPNGRIFSGRVLDFNILEERLNTSNRLKNRSLNMLFDVDWEIISNLNFRTQVGLQRDNGRDQKYASENSYYNRYQIYRSVIGGKEPYLPQGGIIKNDDLVSSQWTVKNVAEYRKTFDEVHELDIMIGNELRRNKEERIFSAAYGYNDKTLTNEPIIFPDEVRARDFPLFKRTFIQGAAYAFYTNVGYTFNNKYTFFGSVRIDGSDMFGADTRDKYLPIWAASGAWRVGEESFMRDLKWVDDLKLRVSYGLQGNVDKETSRYLIGDKKTAVILPGQIEQVIQPSNLPNDRLRWEKTQTWDGGIDLAVFNNRISMSLDVYHRESNDLLSIKQIPLENGMQTVNLNWAKMTNKGVEVNLVTRNIVNSKFRWSTTFNIAKNTNRVDKEYIPDNQTTPSREGLSVNAMFAYKTAGLDEQGYVLFQKGDKKVTAEEFFSLEDPYGGGFFYQSTLNNKELRDLYTHVGDSDPKVTGGINNNFKLGQFSLDIACAFNLGQWIKETPFYDMIEMDRGVNRTRRMNEVWTPDNKSGKFPRMIGPDTEGGDRMADYMAFVPGYVLSSDVFRNLDIWYKKINYLRLSNVRLDYKFSNNIVSKLGLSSLNVNVEARNLFVIASNYDGYFDPETYGNIYAQPMPKSVTVGLNVSF